MIASCGFLEDELRLCSKEEGVTMASGVETLGVDLRTRVKRLGAKEKARRKKCKVRFSSIEKNKVSQRSYMKVESQEVAAMVPARTWEVHAVGMAPTERLKLRQMAAAAKRVRPRCPFSWRLLVLRWRKNSLRAGHSVMGRRGVDSKMAHRTK